MNQAKAIGTKIKEERLRRKMTLKQLSEEVELSIGYLSQVERGYGTLSLNALEKLSKVLEVEMTDFFEDAGKENSGYVVYGYQREKMQISHQTVHYSMSNQIGSLSMRPMMYELYPEQEHQEEQIFCHEEEEVLYMVEGSCIIWVSGQEYFLNPGDCVHIPPHAQHKWRNNTTKIAKLLGVYC